MKVVILAGGLGIRMREEGTNVPKPMVRIGDKPILWHIMKYISMFGYNEFIICCGYQTETIKKFFADYYLNMSDVTFDFVKNKMTLHNNMVEPWKVTLVDTGTHTETGGRVKRIKDYLDDDTFLLTYGDGLSDVDIGRLISFHHSHGKLATITAIKPSERFGVMEIENNHTINSFSEKGNSANWINGGFMVLNSDVIELIEGDTTSLEKDVFEGIAESGHLKAYKHEGFWQCMDTIKDKQYLEQLWSSNIAPWKAW